ncbi:MAG: type II secretion system protein [Thermodesulfobacteriota bacterium]
MAEFFRYNNSAKGFTLLEVMTAVLLLGLSYVAVLESFSSSMHRLNKMEEKLEFFFSQDAVMTENIKYRGPALDYEENDNEIFLEGTTYTLSIATSETGLLQSLQLQRK